MEFPGFSGHCRRGVWAASKASELTAKVTITARAIVERVDIVADVRQCECPIFVDLFLDPILLQTAEERLRDGVDAQQFPLQLMVGSRVIGATEPPAARRSRIEFLDPNGSPFHADAVGGWP